MYETTMTVVGNLTTAVDTRRFTDGTVLARFRIGSTERRYDRVNATWGDGDRLYLDVTCRRQLAENAAASLVKGDPVVVTGRLYTREYEHDGQRRSVITLDAQSVAADLSWCTAVVTRTRRRATGAAEQGGAQPAPVAAATDTATEAAPGADHAPRLVGAAPGGGG